VVYGECAYVVLCLVFLLDGAQDVVDAVIRGFSIIVFLSW